MQIDERTTEIVLEYESPDGGSGEPHLRLIDQSETCELVGTFGSPACGVVLQQLFPSRDGWRRRLTCYSATTQLSSVLLD